MFNYIIAHQTDFIFISLNTSLDIVTKKARWERAQKVSFLTTIIPNKRS